MSAFMVGKKHIDTLVTEALRSDYGSAWGYYHGTHPRVEVTYDTADFIGQMLWNENERSMKARYGGDEPDAESYVFMGASHVSAVQLLKSLDCYEYQACETDDYFQSEAHSFCQALRRRAIGELPGYEAAVWGVPGE